MRAPRHPLWARSAPELFEAALALHDELPWLASAFQEPDSAAYYFWVVNFGLRERPDLFASLLPALPPEARRFEISGTSDQESFLNVGAQAASAVLEALESAGVDPWAPRRILDFGCGCGRVARHLLPLVDGGELAGCDIDESAIATCREALTPARFFVNRKDPPLPVAAGTFDLVYSISVFTHLAVEPARRWAAELNRVLVPGGRALVSLHGDLAWRKLIASRALRRQFLVSERETERAHPRWERDGVAFLGHLVPRAWSRWRGSSLVRRLAPLSWSRSGSYGLLFVSEERLPELWPGWRLAAYRSGAISDWQDLALLVAGSAAEDSTDSTQTRH